MKTNKIFKVLALACSMLFIFSCSSDSDTFGVSNVTNFPLLTLNGDETVFVQQGASYTDPGVIATENNATIPYITKYSGDYRGASTLDLSKPDRYIATYTATNSDGFNANALRSIYVYKTGNFTSSIEGLYKSTVVRNNAASAQYTDMKYVIVWKNTNGTYEVSDAIGGYYEYGRSYGVGYASRGLTFNYTSGTSATVASQASGVGAFGGALVTTAATIDAAAKTIKFTSDWDAGYAFVVTLTQVN